MPAAARTRADAIESDGEFEGPDPVAPPATGETLSTVVPAAMAGARLDQALARLIPELSRARLQQWIRDERISVDGRAARASARVHGGEVLHVSPDPAPAELAARPEPIPLRIVYEDESILVIDKPAGLVVHPGAGNWQGTLVNALLHHDARAAALPRAGLVHRLDKDTSGLMVVARTLAAHTALVRALAAREVERVYQAIVCGRLPAATTVDAPIGRHPVQRTRMAVVPGGRPARTHVRPLGHLEASTWIECRLETGRTHQIRVHLASIGLPLLGDPAYGARAGQLPAGLSAIGSALARQALHAVSLAFAHPSDRRALRFDSPLPADIRGALDALAPGHGQPAAAAAPDAPDPAMREPRRGGTQRPATRARGPAS